MDTAQTINCLEWCFGYGGLHLGLKRVVPGLRLIAACEIEAYAVANMVAKMEAGFMDPAPVWTNVKTFPCEQFRGLVDIFAGGYPCQGFSHAGKRQGMADPRFLWPWFLRTILIIRPLVVFFENVDGHVSLGLSTVISDLEAAGYRVKEGIFSAEEVGAPHVRKRVFILGVLEHSKGKCKRKQADPTDAIPIGREARNEFGQPSQLADPAVERCGEERGDCERSSERTSRSGDLWPARPGESQFEWEPPRTTQPGLGRGADGHTYRVDRLRLCGGGVVPATATKAFVTLFERLMKG